MIEQFSIFNIFKGALHRFYNLSLLVMTVKPVVHCFLWLSKELPDKITMLMSSV